MRFCIALLGALLPGSWALAADEPLVDDKPWKWFALPTASFDTDDGLGMGWRAEAAKEAPGVTPYRTSMVTQGYFSTRGFVDVRFSLDLVDRGPHDNLRVTTFAAFRRWKNDGYWGIGQGTARERDFVGPFDPDAPERKRYRYQLTQPLVHSLVRWDLAPPLALHAALQVKHSDVLIYPDSLLSEQRPFGVDGGWSAQLFLGGMLDTRDNEVDPHHGHWIELTGRAAPAIPGGQGAFVGAFASVRHYTQLHPNVVFGYRVMGEWLAGDVPFYEMVHWGASVPIAGFGGAQGLRAVKFGRYRGPGKAIWNSELRYTFWRPTLRGEPSVVEFSPWFDGGVVFGEGTSAQSGEWPVHPAAGVGLRLVYAGQFTGRVDVGYGHDPILSNAGVLGPGNTLGFYTTFGHAF